MVVLLIIAAASYLIGSISPSILIGKVFFNVDVRSVGSGNAGMTNAFRALGKTAGILVALIDIFKGFAASWWVASFRMGDTGWTFAHEPMLIGSFALDPVLVQIIAGAFVVVGHIFPLFFGFRGGKGVLTMAGVILGLSPLPVLICFGLFALVFGLSRYVSLGSITAAVAFPIVVSVQRFVFGTPVSDYLLGFSVLAAALIVVTHLGNIRRLIRGEENRFGKKKVAVHSD